MKTTHKRHYTEADLAEAFVGLRQVPSLNVATVNGVWLMETIDEAPAPAMERFEARMGYPPDVWYLRPGIYYLGREMAP